MIRVDGLDFEIPTPVVREIESGQTQHFSPSKPLIPMPAMALEVGIGLDLIAVLRPHEVFSSESERSENDRNLYVLADSGKFREVEAYGFDDGDRMKDYYLNQNTYPTFLDAEMRMRADRQPLTILPFKCAYLAINEAQLRQQWLNRENRDMTRREAVDGAEMLQIVTTEVTPIYEGFWELKDAPRLTSRASSDEGNLIVTNNGTSSISVVSAQ